jgi:serine/threonine-protein kinase
MPEETVEFESREQRVDEAVAAYLAAEDQGSAPDRQEYLARYPDLQPELEQFLADHDGVRQGMARHDDAATGTYTGTSPNPDLGELRWLGDYELIEEIGRGGMGVVFKARHRRLNCIRALKRTPAVRLNSPAGLQQFQFEAEAMASLDHPHIVPVHEVGEHQGHWFFSMKWLEGGSLAQRLPHYRDDLRAAVRLMVAIAHAMHHAHQRRILHRDLKPSNILLDAEGRPYVSDFGLAQWAEDPMELTVDGYIVGTLSYMAPEQASGRKGAVTTASDIYGLGAILYELLTGRPPFRGGTIIETLRQVQECTPQRPRMINPAVDRDLEAICLNCLEKKPELRYRSADALADDLERWLRGEPTLARPISGAERLWRWCRRHPAAVILTALAVGSLIAATATAIVVARAREAMLLQEVGRSNLYAARFVARTLLAELEDLSSPLARAAVDSRLRELLEQDNRNGLQAYVENVHRTVADPARGIVRPEEGNPFESWFVLDAKGKICAIAPANPLIIGRDFHGRDYFRCALQHAGELDEALVHVSQVYEAANDGLFKFAMAAPVCAGEGPEARVLGVIATTITTTSKLGQVMLDDDRRKVVLVGREDPNAPGGEGPVAGPTSYVILRHPAYEHGEPALPVPGRRLRTIHRPKHGNEFRLTDEGREPDPAQAIDLNYRDPVADRDRSYGGRWLAGFAPVGNTELVVLVQQRYDETVASDRSLTLGLSLWGAVAAFLCAILVGVAGFAALRAGRRRTP